MGMRMNLKLLRVKHQLNQEQMGARCGVGRNAYAHIEQGLKNGKPQFWERLKKEFNIPNSEMWDLMTKQFDL